jgi:hypothetical protein
VNTIPKQIRALAINFVFLADDNDINIISQFR